MPKVFSNPLQDKFNKWLKSANLLIIMGIGNSLRGDDGVGPWISSRLESYNLKHTLPITAFTAPENMIGLIIKHQPTHLLIIDAAILPSIKNSTTDTEESPVTQPPGSWSLIRFERFYELPVSTHSGTMNMIIKRLSDQLPTLNIRFLVIQPETTILTDQLSKAIQKSARRLLKIIVENRKGIN